MKLSEQLEVISAPDRIRIIRGERKNRDPDQDPNQEILFCGYKAMIEYHDDAMSWLIKDPEVKRLVASMEIRHKKFKERGLMPPYEPDITRQYEFSDLTIFLYYDIYI